MTPDDGASMPGLDLWQHYLTAGSHDSPDRDQTGSACNIESMTQAAEVSSGILRQFTDKISLREDTSKGNAKAEKDSPNRPCSKTLAPTTIDSFPKVTFNVGGIIFQTLLVTFRKSKWKNEQFQAYYDPTNDEYFFDRDPEVFRSVLNYWRTGKLHLPLSRCGPSVHDELVFWGLEELDIEPCCWNNYNSGIATTASLDKLRRDALKAREADFIEDPTSRLGQWRLTIWYILTTSSYSRTAKMFEVMAVFFALLSIFSMCASTTDVFHVKADLVPGTNVTFNMSQVPMDAMFMFYRQQVFDTKASRNYTVHPLLNYIDYLCLVIFTLEYTGRLLCTPQLCRFLISVSALIDFLALLPDYILLTVSEIDSYRHNLALVELLPLLRLMRVIRIFRVIRRVPGLWTMIYTLKASYRELFLMLLFMLIGTLLFGSIIYFVDDERVFTSIPKGFWWAIVTMTTVGYGDMVPSTPAGQLVGSVTTICGVLLIAFTIPSLVNNFINYSVLIQYDTNQKMLLVEKEAQPSDASKVRKVTPQDYRMMVTAPLETSSAR